MLSIYNLIIHLGTKEMITRYICEDFGPTVTKSRARTYIYYLTSRLPALMMSL